MTYRAWNTKTVDRAALKELTAAIAQQNTEELEYQNMDEEWSEEKYRSVLAAQQKEAGLLAGILAARGITDPAEALTLLAGEEELSDPMLLTDMDKACERILRAIDEGETIVVFGDYDVDGVTATALLYQHLKGMGAAVKCMLPSREGDGYGLSKNAIQSIYDKGCRLIVTVDNGISAVEEAAFAASLGIDLIITDHHLPHDTLPQAVAIVDPRRADDHSPFKGLCGAGVAFKLCAALDGCPPEEMLEYCGDLAAVGTVADVMPLTGENRTIVKAGLRQLQNTDRPGFCALLEEVGLAGKPVTAENISYAIAPRINAAGRMDSAVTALQLVLCEDEDRAVELTHKLSDINIQRQETEMEIVKAAQELLEGEDISTEMHKMLRENIDSSCAQFLSGDVKDEWDFGALRRHYQGWLTTDADFHYTVADFDNLSQQGIADMLYDRGMQILQAKEVRYGAPVMRELERICLLKCVDRQWMDHIDNMDQLRQGIALRGYGQKDPVVEYRIEGFDMFEQMVDSIRESSVKMLLTIELRAAGSAPKREQVAKPTGEGFVPGNGAPGVKGSPKGQPVRVVKIGRNDPCPCGSGLKFKKCTCAQYHPTGNNGGEE